nr:uncharacterized protein LOC104117292 [Nicotiana tomentosiformis]
MKRKIGTGSMRKNGILSVEGMNKKRRNIEAEHVIVIEVMILSRGLDMMIYILVEREDMLMTSMQTSGLGGESCFRLCHARISRVSAVSGGKIADAKHKEEKLG